MTKPSLSQLYRNDAAVTAVNALLRELEPASAALARDLAVLHAPAHGRRGQAHHAARAAHAPRRREPGWQWGALAASLIAGLALWAAHGTMGPRGSESALAQSPLREDRIFLWVSGPQVASESRGRANDRIFSTSEGAHRADQIFDGGFGGGMH